MCAITAITAQNTVSVSEIHAVPEQVILAQVRSLVQDIGIDAVKVGMLGTVEATLAVAEALDELPSGTPVVVDPVMIAESGARLLEADAHRALVQEILPRASVITPNLPEAQALAGLDEVDPSPTDRDIELLAHKLVGLGPQAVVITGGHRQRAIDLFLSGDGQVVEIRGERHPDGASHGSGCTHSSVLAAQLALGYEPLEAARTARAMTAIAVANGLRDIGHGAGPVDILGLRSRRAQKSARERCDGLS